MTAKELVGAVVRLAGLGLLLFAFFDLYYVIVKTAGIYTESTLPVSRDVHGFVVYSILGLCIIAGAKWIAGLVYWNNDRD
jgi:hypothetical protein